MRRLSFLAALFLTLGVGLSHAQLSVGVSGSPAVNDCMKWAGGGKIQSAGGQCTTSGSSAPTDAPYFTNAAVAGLSAEVVPAANVITFMGAADYAAMRTQLSLTSLATTTPGTGVATALAANVGSAGAPVLFNGAGGTPSSLTGTNITGVPIATGITGTLANLGTALTDEAAGSMTFLATPSLANLGTLLTDDASGATTFLTTPSLANLAALLTDEGTGFATAMATPSGTNLAAFFTDESGTGVPCFTTSCVMVTPNLGTPSALIGTNVTAVPIATGITGSSANLRTALTDEVGTGNAVFASALTSCTLALTYATPGDLSLGSTTSACRYVDDGLTVNLQGTLVTTPTFTTASGEARITGLPSAPNGTSLLFSTGPLVVQGLTMATYTNFVVKATPSQTYLVIDASGSGVSETTATTTHLASGTSKTFEFSITYFK